MHSLILIFGRAFLQVLLVAGNTVQLATYQRSGHLSTLVGAGVIGMMISWVWWANSRSTSTEDTLGARRAYALGAGCGTIAGAWIIAWWYR